MSDCICHPAHRCGRCPAAACDWWIHFCLFWWVLGGAVNGVPIRIYDGEDIDADAA
jgi:hypothetical protein